MQLLRFALGLLRALLGFALQFFDLLLHCGDLLFLFDQGQLGLGFGILLRLDTNVSDFRLDLGLDGEVHFAAGIVQLTFPADHFGLGLLRGGELAAALFQLTLHRGDLVFLLGDTQPRGFFGFLPCFLADGAEFGLDLVLDGEVHLAPRVFELAFLARKFSLRLLSDRKLAVALGDDRAEVGDLLRLCINLDRRKALGLGDFLGADALAFTLELHGDRAIDCGALLFKRGLLIAHGLFARGEVRVLPGERLLEFRFGRLQEWRGE